jgi:hypothetical protein
MTQDAAKVVAALSRIPCAFELHSFRLYTDDEWYWRECNRCHIKRGWVSRASALLIAKARANDQRARALLQNRTL